MPWIEANGTSFHYKIEGNAGAVVVLLHELGGTLDSWDGVVPARRAPSRVPLRSARVRSRKVRAHIHARYARRRPAGAVARTLARRTVPSFRSLPQHAGVAVHGTRSKAVASLCSAIPRPASIPRAPKRWRKSHRKPSEGIRGVLPQMLDRSYPPELSDRETYENYRGRYLGNDPVGFALAFRVLAVTDKRGSLGKRRLSGDGRRRQSGRRASVAGSQAIAGQIPGRGSKRSTPDTSCPRPTKRFSLFFDFK